MSASHLVRTWKGPEPRPAWNQAAFAPTPAPAPWHPADPDRAEASPLSAMSPVDNPAEQSSAVRFRLWLLLSASLVWGVSTAFSQWSEHYATLMQGAGLATGIGLVLIALGTPVLVNWLTCHSGQLLLAHAAFACVSGMIAGSELASMVRYLALVPAFSLMLAVQRAGEPAVGQFRLGLTMAGVLFLFYHLAFLDLGSLAQSHYRLTVFLNPNSLGFIAAATGISALDYVLSRERPDKIRLLWAVVFVICGALWLSTKSRTALLAILMGATTLGALRLRSFRARAAVAVLGVVAAVFLAQMKGVLVDTLSLQDRYRSIASATGRFDIWHYILTDLWPNALWLGVGPGLHQDMVLKATLSSSAHNGFLMALSETGLLGTLPLAALVLMGGLVCWRDRNQPRLFWAISLFAVGVTESMGEIIFFSIGNPGSLLFLLAVATLAGRFPGRDEAPPQPVNPRFNHLAKPAEGAA